MNEKNINSMYSSIVNLLQQSRLKEAQTQAEALLNSTFAYAQTYGTLLTGHESNCWTKSLPTTTTS